MSDYPKVVITGRVNVGKSTLFNKLSTEKKVLVSPIPGTTRDLNQGLANWQDNIFKIIDTGGLNIVKKSLIEIDVIKKADQAIRKADLILFVVDGREELLPEDRDFARYIRKLKKSVLLVVNKIDNPSLRQKITPDFFKLGLGQPMIISALMGIGVGDLLDEITKRIKKTKPSIHEANYDLRLSIIGKTNVGKSSIFNAILGEEKVIVTPLPHTTRDPQDTLIDYQEKKILLVDTAGMRKKSKIPNFLERLSREKTLQAIRDSDISLFITDISDPLSVQDKKIAELGLKNENGIIIVANKWDLIREKTDKVFKKFTDYYQRYFPYLWWAPIIFVSAMEKQRMNKILDLAFEIKSDREKIIDKKELHYFAKGFFYKTLGKNAYHSSEQTGINPPQFIFKIKYKDRLKPNFQKLMEKRLRQEFGFLGTPIKITIKQA